MESTYIDQLGKAQESLLATRQKPPIEGESKRCVTQTSGGSKPCQLTSSSLAQGHLPAEDQQYLNVTAYVHEWSHAALDEKGLYQQG
jgi:hypothetical protein